MARGHNTICGLNTVGLRRAGIDAAERLELKKLYHALFRNGLNLRNALAAAQDRFFSVSARLMLEFIGSARRGVCADAGNDGPTEDEDVAE
jgi:UDP-N-acetylglucosamine acyltransferase